MHVLPYAGILENKLIKTSVAEDIYHTRKLTPGFWKYNGRTLNFCLTVDYFRIKYVGKSHTEHLIEALQKYYTFEIDWEGTLYYGLKLTWDNKNEQLKYLCPDISKKSSTNSSTLQLNTPNILSTKQRQRNTSPGSNIKK